MKRYRIYNHTRMGGAGTGHMANQDGNGPSDALAKALKIESLVGPPVYEGDPPYLGAGDIVSVVSEDFGDMPFIVRLESPTIPSLTFTEVQ